MDDKLQKWFLTGLLGWMLLVVVLLGILVFKPIIRLDQEQLRGLVPHGPVITSMATSGPITITGGAGAILNNELLLATTSRRSYALITNDCTSPVYLSFNDEIRFKQDRLASGPRLNASGGKYEIDQNNLYVGAIRASSSAVCRLSVTQSVF